MIKYATYQFYRNVKTGEVIQVPLGEEDELDKTAWVRDREAEKDEMEKVANGSR